MPDDLKAQGEDKFLFVSHTTADAGFVEREIVPLASDHYLDSHFANYSRGGAQLYMRRIMESLARCARFLAILSPRAVASDWVRFEVAWAFIHRSPQRILPVLIEPCDYLSLSPRFAEISLVDFYRDPVAARSAVSSHFRSHASNRWPL